MKWSSPYQHPSPFRLLNPNRQRPPISLQLRFQLKLLSHRYRHHHYHHHYRYHHHCHHYHHHRLLQDRRQVQPSGKGSIIERDQREIGETIARIESISPLSLMGTSPCDVVGSKSDKASFIPRNWLNSKPSSSKWRLQISFHPLIAGLRSLKEHSRSISSCNRLGLGGTSAFMHGTALSRESASAEILSRSMRSKRMSRRWSNTKSALQAIQALHRLPRLHRLPCQHQP